MEYAGEALLSERLTAALKREMRALESDPGGGEAAGAKGRIEAIGQMTRTLEKLLELKRLEELAARGDAAEDDAETLRLREELLSRLRAIDAKRRTGPTLFGADGTLGGAPGESPPEEAAASVGSG